MNLINSQFDDFLNWQSEIGIMLIKKLMTSGRVYFLLNGQA